ncbi:MAG: aldehyde dehydrogenase family protein [Planctomycetota bacterium]
MNIQFMNNQELAEKLLLMRIAQGQWEQLPIKDKLQKVRKFRHLLVVQRDKIAKALFLDSGKPYEEALGAEILPLAEACKFLEKNAAHLLSPRKIRSSDTPWWLFLQKSKVHRKARGIVGIIGTWNYPLFLNGVQIIQALVAGNGVVWKPSENALETNKILAELLLETFPQNIFKELSSSRESGPVLIDSNIDFVVMTGSVETGKAIAKKCAERLIPSTLELSGIDSLLLLDDGDVDLAVNAAWFAMNINAGQTCMASRRFLIPETMLEKVATKLLELARNFKPRKILMESQADCALPLIDAAMVEGAELIWPLNKSDIWKDGHFDACILINIREEMRICNEAIFAPILSVITYKTIEDAIRISNACSFGLCASIFTSSVQVGEKIALALKVGSVSINDAIVPHAHPATPFGGVGLSGWGATQGEEGLLEMTRPMSISIVSGKFRPHYELATPKATDSIPIVEGILLALHSPNWVGRIKGWIQFLSGAKKK